jgi:hypothetical protein
MNASLKLIVDKKIELKLSILNQWCKDIPWQMHADGSYILDTNSLRSIEYFPTTLAAFARWDGSENSELTRLNLLTGIESISIGSVTAVYRAATCKTIENTMSTLAELKKLKVEKTFKQGEIFALTADNRYLKCLCDQNDLEIAKMQQRILITGRDLEGEKRKHQNTKDEAIRRIDQLQKQVAELTATLAKIRGIK